MDKWAQLVEEYRYIYELDRKTEENNRLMLEYNIKKTLYELANALYGKK